MAKISHGQDFSGEINHGPSLPSLVLVLSFMCGGVIVAVGRPSVSLVVLADVGDLDRVDVACWCLFFGRLVGFLFCRVLVLFFVVW